MAKNKPYRPGGKPDATGRSHRDGRHVRFYETMLATAAYRDLRPAARCLLIELARLYNGRNNGEIALGEREAVRLLGMTDRTAARRALAELEAHGFITKTKPSGFNLKDRSTRRATEWRLEWLPVSAGPGRPECRPTWLFNQWPNLPAERD
jgi:hypothetical protein